MNMVYFHYDTLENINIEESVMNTDEQLSL